MIQIICENELGNSIDFSSEKQYTLTNVIGLNPPDANIVTYSIPSMDGEIYRTSKLQTRNIVLTFALKAPIEENRLNVYRVFRSKHYIKVSLKTATLNVFTEGFVESVTCNNFSNKQTVQVSILCPDSYFKNLNGFDKTFNKADDYGFAFEFYTTDDNPISLGTIPDSNLTGVVDIINNGDTETGIIIQVKPKYGYIIDKVMVKDLTTGNYIYTSKVLSSFMNECLTINTKKGEKGVFTTYIHPETSEIVEKSIIDTCIINGWLEALPGITTLQIEFGTIPIGYVLNQTDENDLVVPTDDALQDLTLYDAYHQGITTNRFAHADVTVQIDEKWQGV